MNWNTVLLAAGCLTLGGVSAVAQASPRKSADSPEMEYLRRLIAEQQKNPDKIIRSVPATNPPTPAASSPQPTKPPPANAKPVPVEAKGAPSQIKSPGTVAPATTPASPTPQQKQLSEVESRLDEMLRQKAERDKAVLTNAPTTNSLPATPQTKRQRLDALLKQFIDGKIGGAEYNEKRRQIVAEPD